MSASLYQALRITRGTSSGQSASGSLLIEQEAWSPYVAYLTKGGAVAYLNALLFGGPDDGPLENCGIGPDGSVSTEIYTYPNPPDLAYHFAATHGTIGAKIIETLEYTEILQVQGEQTPALRYPTQAILSAAWMTEAYSLIGATTPTGLISTADGRVTLDAAGLYGTLLVTYLVRRHRYTITVPERADELDNRFICFFYATWDGGNAVREFKPPADGEDSASSAAKARCNTRIGSGLGSIFGMSPTSIANPAGLQVSDDPPPTARPEDIDYVKDYCTGEVRKA